MCYVENLCVTRVVPINSVRWLKTNKCAHRCCHAFMVRFIEFRSIIHSEHKMRWLCINLFLFLFWALWELCTFLSSRTDFFLPEPRLNLCIGKNIFMVKLSCCNHIFHFLSGKSSTDFSRFIDFSIGGEALIEELS